MLGNFIAEIPLLNGEKTQIRITEIVTPTTKHTIPGKGLPYPKNTETKGDCNVLFKIKFPDSLNEQTKEMISTLLPE